MVDLSLLSKAIEEGNRDKAVQLTTEALSAGASPQDIIAHGLQSGMGVVGKKFSSGEYFLPESGHQLTPYLAALFQNFVPDPVGINHHRPQFR